MSEINPTESLSPAPLDTALVGSRVLVYDAVDSTSDLAARLDGDGVVVVADAQVAGRGRHGRRWESRAGLGLWFSIGFDGLLHSLAPAAVLSVRDALAPHLTEVKWPNDLLMGGRKICGVLVEHRRGRTVLGVGVNVLHQAEDFPVELRGVATSLLMQTGERYARGSLLRDILQALDKRLLAIQTQEPTSALQQEWEEACGMVGRTVRSNDLQGVVEAIDASGALVLATDEGLRRVAHGDVLVVERS